MAPNKGGRPRKPGGPDPTRSLRIGPVWDRAKAKAEREGTTITAVIVDALTDYTQEDTVSPQMLTEQIAHHRKMAESTIMWSEHKYHLWMVTRLGCQLDALAGTHAPEWSRIARSSCPAGCGVYQCTCGNREVRHDGECARQNPYA